MVPRITPGIKPTTMSDNRRHTDGIASRLTNNTYAFSNTSIGTNAGFRTRLDKKSSASGTVIEEKP